MSFDYTLWNHYHCYSGECSAHVCDNVKCLNGGTCQAESADSSVCLCPLGSAGDRCETSEWMPQLLSLRKLMNFIVNFRCMITVSYNHIKINVVVSTRSKNKVHVLCSTKNVPCSIFRNWHPCAPLRRYFLHAIPGSPTHSTLLCWSRNRAETWSSRRSHILQWLHNR